MKRTREITESVPTYFLFTENDEESGDDTNVLFTPTTDLGCELMSVLFMATDLEMRGTIYRIIYNRILDDEDIDDDEDKALYVFIQKVVPALTRASDIGDAVYWEEASRVPCIPVLIDVAY